MGSAYTKSPYPAFFRILSVERLYPCGWRTFVNSSAIVSGVLSPKFPVTSTECVARLDFAFVTYGTSVSSLSVIKIHALQCIPLTWNVYVFCSDSGMGRTILPHQPSFLRLDLETAGYMQSIKTLGGMIGRYEYLLGCSNFLC